MRRQFLFLPGIFIFLPVLVLGAEELTLEKATSLALKNNPTVLGLLSEYDRLMSRVKFTQGLYDWGVSLGGDYQDVESPTNNAFLPTRSKETSYDLGINKDFWSGTRLGLTSFYTKTDDNGIFNAFNKRYQTGVALTVEQALLQDFVGLPKRAELKANEMRLEALKYQLWRDLELFSSQVSLAYWRLKRDSQFLAIAEKNKKEAKTFYDRTKRLKNIGLREDDEILQSEAEYLQRHQETLTAKSDQKNSWSTLKRLLGVDQSPEWKEVPNLPDPTWIDLTQDEELFQKAFQNRSDVLASEKTSQADQTVREGLKGNLLPGLNLNGGYSLTGLDPQSSDSISQVTEAQFNGWNIGMVLTHSFGQNIDRAEILEADANLKRSQAAYKDQLLAVREEIEKARENFGLNTDLYEVTKKLEKKREAISKAFDEKFEQGRLSIQDLIRAQNEKNDARFRRQFAETTLAITEMELRVATGTYLETVYSEDRNPLPLLQGYQP